MSKKKLLKTIHDASLGFFVNAGYSLTQGGAVLPNVYVIIVTIILMYLTNEE
ncbi:hypothetical protein [Caminibacter sp.]